jgi:hypothetical protein
MDGQQFHKPEIPSQVYHSWITAENVFYGIVVATLLDMVAIIVAPPDQRILTLARVLLFASWAGLALVVYKSHLFHATSPVTRGIGKCAIVIIVGAVALSAWLHWMDTPRVRRIARNKTLMDDCRADYILSHNPVEADILDGHKPPPSEYCNPKFVAMGEQLKITDAPPPLPAPTVLSGPIASVPSKKHPPTARTNEKANPQSISPQPLLTVLPRDRAFVGVAVVTLHTDPMAASTVITVKNYSSIPTVGTTVVLIGIIPSVLLPDSVSEDKLFQYRPEWQYGGGMKDNILGPGDTFNAKANYGWGISLDEWAALNSGREVVYVVTETDSGDRLGRLPPVRSCWYVQAPDWINFHLCFGHNGLAAKARLGGGLNK